MTSFNTALTHLVCKAVVGHILLVLLLISRYQITFRHLLSTLAVYASSVTTDTNAQMEGEQDNRTGEARTGYTTH